MYALPHHLMSFEDATAASVDSALQLYSLTNGLMQGVVASEWRMVEKSLPVRTTWLPIAGNGSARFSPKALRKMSAIARLEVAQNFTAQVDVPSMYFSGKV
jgi:endo-1,3(4)-beta-glucanase